ncbi:MAG: radical SAM family heme chaperone HemW [Clostridia bacterium]|nr:radical SAM family heme chaperone HemW [Clostridia bacterium]
MYIHVPFCLSKCPYCDFYSIPLPDDAMLDHYVDAVCRTLRQERARTDEDADTLYFGGGTPSLLGGKRLTRILAEAQRLFRLQEAEITMEANPADELYETFAAFRAAGGNRVSLGMQSVSADGLRRLGRRHTPAQLEVAIRDLSRADIRNFSLDLMLATPGQTPTDIENAVSFAAAAGASHLSAYLLKLEPGTPFYAAADTLALPDEDAVAAYYLLACREAEAAGYRQYEISNFAKPGCESRHNLKYWNSDDYIGIGPAAHSAVSGQRYHYPRSLDAFLAGCKPEIDRDDEIPTGSPAEYAMLRLRLTDGLQADLFEQRFGKPLPPEWRENAAALPSSLVTVSPADIALTRDGFLLSNTLIAEILWK